MNNSSQLERMATRMLEGKRKTRRGKKNKPNHVLFWNKEKEKSLKLYKQQKKERGQQFKDFNRLVEKD